MPKSCSGCGGEPGFLKLTWIKEPNLFFCPTCYSIYEEYMIEGRFKLLAEINKLRVLINAGEHCAILESAMPNKDATGE